MEGRMTVCNMSIEMRGAGRHDRSRPERRSTTCAGSERAPQGAAFDQAVARWEQLYSDADAVFDKEVTGSMLPTSAPMITYGTNPGMGMAVDALYP